MLQTLLLLALSLTARAELFRNAYVSFELPQNWSCTLEGTQWTCTSKFSKETKEAIIVLTAKEVGPSDSLEAFENELKISRPLNSSPGSAMSKVVQPPKKRLIADHPWIDAIHIDSEVPSYYTRYLATVKDRLSIGVTFSAYKTHYTKYSADFLKAVESLRTVANKDLLATQPILNPRTSGTETIGAPIAGPGIGGPGIPPEPKKSNNLEIYLAALILLAAGGYLLWRRK